jgi:hypothetical protein
MARRPRRNPRSTGYVAAKIRANTARKNAGIHTKHLSYLGKTYAQLMTELRWLGPGVVATWIEHGTTHQCSSLASSVAYYLQERGFAARTDTGAGKYSGHYDLAVYTQDAGWISVDPTAIQFHSPASLSVALAQAQAEGRKDDLGPTQAELVLAAKKLFQPTVLTSVAGIEDGIEAFEVLRAPHIRRRKEPDFRDYGGERRAPTPKEFNSGVYGASTWRAHWQELRERAHALVRGEIPLFYEAAYQSYWAQEVKRRIQERR